jgi:mannose-6-phosphate isomerase-like protein (cupin superfamily)
MQIRYCETDPYITLDGSLVRELFHPERHGPSPLSLAEATVPIGGSTFLHRHALSEELYHVVSGEGMMTLGGETFPISRGDTIRILPGVPHALENTGEASLRILCCCAPPYSHADTELLGRDS